MTSADVSVIAPEDRGNADQTGANAAMLGSNVAGARSGPLPSPMPWLAAAGHRLLAILIGPPCHSAE